MANLRGLFSTMFVKLFLMLALASLLVFSGLLYSALSSSREALTKQKSEDMTMFIARTGQYLDLYLQNIRNILISLSDRIDDDMLDHPAELEQVMQEHIKRNSGIASYMFVQRRDGAIVSSDQLVYGVVGHPELPRIFRMAEERPGLVRWSELYYSPMLTDRTIAFALNLKGGSGTVLLEINTSQLTRKLHELLHSSGQGFALFTGQEGIVSYDPYSSIVPYKPATLPPEMDEQFAGTLRELSRGISRIEGAAGPLMVVKSERNELGWYFVTMTDERDFREATNKLLARFLGIGALWFSLLIVLTLFISRHFTTPVNRLALQMDRIRGERFVDPYRQIERSDEIGRLSRSFYTMIGRIQELLATVRENEERKKAMEMELLLHQIRPHFLYNTLSCIGSLAKQHRVEEVEETIRSLIGLLTYSIGRNEFVTLEEEMQALREYIQIQNVRYGDAFHYADKIDPSHAQLPVLKLILQPLVENSIFHGLAARGEGSILVRAWVEDAKLLLCVWDDGEGMTAGQIAAALAAAPAQEGDNPPSRVRSGRFNGIGLSNVKERILLHYGPAYGLHIRSELGRWTEVTVVLPLP